VDTLLIVLGGLLLGGAWSLRSQRAPWWLVVLVVVVAVLSLIAAVLVT